MMATTPAAPTATRLPLLAVLSAMAGFLAWQVLAFLRAGTFEYPLDDPYIHLAMAEGIANGTYGINPGEPASAASSIIYPVLLLPFVGSEFQRFLPLLWNIGALALLALTWGRIVRDARLPNGLALFCAAVGPIALAMPFVAALGMEHTLHALAVAVLVQALWRFLTTGTIGYALILSAILAPLLRYEGLALSLLAAATLVWRGRIASGVALGAAILAGPALFGLFLLGQGLDPLPSSVLAKMGDETRSLSPLLNILKVAGGSGAGIFFSAVAMLLLTLVTPTVWSNRNLRLILGIVTMAVLAQVLAGNAFWFNRYEHYAMVMIGTVLVIALPHLSDRLKQVFKVAMLIWALGYGWYNAVFYSWNPRSVLLEQEQMARLTDLLPGEAVAVNDIGKVSWKRDVLVLDLWGLASREARLARLPGKGSVPSTEWAGALVREHGVRYAMIYDEWIAGGIGHDWRPVVRLTMEPEQGLEGGAFVTIYATDPGFEPELRAAIDKLRPTLPEGAVLTDLN
ncbi:hypothetical protein OU426_10840 [Frigidibacter sp. RF13]|uniref:hypothetical protein n=1 Tax=Frigidibacter sp. RF13 TaxID=2997340 RepID=UPI00226E1A42|nr:hypothetical protein [Frigidibacter sp. RF13]MCY1127349.1 hypothetical protein [Frigidibacter sp. RF13]